MPNLYILAGCNGAGKTTAAYTLLPEVLGVFEFVNADEIARGLSPFNSDSVAFEAGRLMLQRIEYLMRQAVDFAFETTLSTRSYVQTIGKARNLGYTIHLFYVYLESSQMAVERVAKRVSEGGHAIPEDVIHRRYQRSLQNFYQLYAPICDFFLFINNSLQGPQKVAQGGLQSELNIANYDLWYQLVETYGNQSKKRS